MCAPVGVNHEENEQRIPGHADQMAAFFAIDNPISSHPGERDHRTR
jgi:hypothetical protein